jgi:hypothetical protein
LSLGAPERLDRRASEIPRQQRLECWIDGVME